MQTLRRRMLRCQHDQRGTTLIEQLIVMVMLTAVVGAIMDALTQLTSAQGRDQAYAQEVSSTQNALMRLAHDLRQATSFQLIAPDKIVFQMTVGGTTYNIRYDCSAPDTLGSPYTRCARTQATAPTAAPAATSALGSLDIQHVYNNGLYNGFNTFCNSAGSGPSGSVFFVQNPYIANNDGSTLACDESYENLVGPQLKLPTYVRVRVEVPASGDLMRGGLKHHTVLQVGTYIPNSDSGA